MSGAFLDAVDAAVDAAVSAAPFTLSSVLGHLAARGCVSRFETCMGRHGCLSGCRAIMVTITCCSSLLGHSNPQGLHIEGHGATAGKAMANALQSPELQAQLRRGA